ncbi:MAG: DUF5776 domain-containing protein [Lactobacillales bacterium]|nr:DUF5776 domain-containing protein [Lactobacillales bacterium]
MKIKFSLLVIFILALFGAVEKANAEETTDFFQSILVETPVPPMDKITYGNSLLEKLIAQPRTDFIDISNWNGVPSVEELEKLKSIGVKGVVILLSQGTYWTNKSASEQIANAQKAGLVVSVYHYSMYSNINDTIAEAEFFIKQVESLDLPPNTTLVNDLEDNYLLVNDSNGQANSRSEITTHALLFQNELNKAGYPYIVHYTNPTFLLTHVTLPQIGRQNIWLAHYNLVQGQSPIYQDFAAWQWGQAAYFIANRPVEVDANLDYLGRFTQKNLLVDYSKNYTYSTGAVYLKKDMNSYLTDGLTNEFRSYSAGSIVSTVGVTTNQSGVPRFVLSDGSYLSTDKTEMIQILAGYFIELPKELEVKENVKSYNNTYLNGSSVKEYKKGTKLSPKKLSVEKDGKTVFELPDESFLSAEKVLYNEID